jgi:hypothetical protein
MERPKGYGGGEINPDDALSFRLALSVLPGFVPGIHGATYQLPNGCQTSHPANGRKNSAGAVSHSEA